MLSNMDPIEAHIRAMLAVVYMPADLDMWFGTPHALLGGRTARRAIADGDGDAVLVIADQLMTGAYV